MKSDTGWLVERVTPEGASPTFDSMDLPYLYIEPGRVLVFQRHEDPDHEEQESILLNSPEWKTVVHDVG